MATSESPAVFRRFQALIAAQVVSTLSDRELLERFIERREEAAFAALVERHGPMVLRVCWSVLHHLQDAEDAFQATFLVLARKAESIRNQASLGSWLHGVAYRLAQKLTAKTMARCRLEASRVGANQTAAEGDLTCRELQRVLHEELNRLQEKHRAPLLLCYLEGKTRDEAAAILGLALGTLKGRLERGRDRLRRALARRGLALASALAVVTTSHQVLGAAAPAGLVRATIQAACLFAARQPVAPSAQAAAALAEGSLRALAAAKLKAVVLLISLCVLAAGAIAQSRSSGSQPAPPDNDRANHSTIALADPAGDKVPGDRTDELGDPLPAGAVARLGSLRWRHDGEAHTLSFAPDGKTLVVNSREEGLIYFFETATGKVIHRLRPASRNDWGIDTLAFSPDGRFLATQGMSADIRLWDPKTKKLVRTLAAPGKNFGPGQFRSICFSADGKRLAASAGPDHIVIWDVGLGQPVAELRGHKHSNPALAFHPDGTMLALVARDPIVQFWDARTGKFLRGFNPKQPHPLSIAFSRDGKTVATGSQHGEGDQPDVILVSEASTGKELSRLEAKKMNGVLELAFTPDGKTLVSGSEDAKVRVWDLTTSKERFVLDSRGWIGRSLAVSADGKTVAMGTVYNMIRLWDVTTGQERFAEPAGHDAPVHAVAYSPDGKLLVSGGENQQIRVWDANNGKPIRRIIASAKSLSFSPDGERLALVWLWKKLLRIWDIDQGSETLAMEHQGANELLSVVFASDNKKVVTIAMMDREQGASFKGRLFVWDAISGKALQTLELPELWPHCLALAPSGRYAAVGGDSHVSTLRLCDLQRGTELHQLLKEPGVVFAAAFSPDGKLLASGGGDTSARVWEVATGKEIFKFQGHQRSVAAVAFTPDGRVLATADGGGRTPHWQGNPPQSIRCWELATGRELLRLDGHDSDVTSLAFTPNGTRLSAGLRNGTVLVWDMTRKWKPPSLETKKLAANDWDALWTTLAADDARQAYPAVWALAAAADQATLVWKERLRPAQKIDAAKVQQWLADLGSEQFAVRDAATRGLSALGEDIEPALQKALAEQRPLESHRRIERLLAAIKTSSLPDQNRMLRVIWALEIAATPAARKLLNDFAEGPPEARLTREANAAIERLRRPRTP